MVGSDFVSEADWLDIISDSYADLYDKLVNTFEDYYVTGPTEFAVSSGNTQALPADFYKLRALDKSTGGEWRQVKEFNFNERNRTPTGSVNGTFRYWHVPAPDRFTASADTFSVYGWDRWIVADAARKALIQEESDTVALERELARIDDQINVAAQNRMLEDGGRIVDVNDQSDVADVRYTIMGSNIYLVPWDQSYRRRSF